MAIVTDAELERLARMARHGDADAYSILHWMFAAVLNDAAMTGAISATAARMLAEMHGRIAAGTDARAAMLAESPPSRPPKILRNTRIVEFIDCLLVHFGHVETKAAPAKAKRPPMTELFRIAGKAFGLSPKTVAGIWNDKAD